MVTWYELSVKHFTFLLLVSITNGSEILKTRRVKENDGSRVHIVRLDAAVDETNQSGQEVTVKVGRKHHDVLQNKRRRVWLGEAVREVGKAAGRITP